MKKTDTYLLEMISSGSKNAFTELYQKHVHAINQFVYKKTNNELLTEDITQEFWLYVWENPKDFMPKSKNTSVKAYMLQYVRFRIFDAFRSSLPQEISLDNFTVSASEEIWYSHVLESIEEKELYEHIKEIIRAHSDVKQKVFHLRLSNHSINEIAEELSLSKRTVYNYYHETLNDVRTVIKKKHPELVKNFLKHNNQKVASQLSMMLFILFT